MFFGKAKVKDLGFKAKAKAKNFGLKADRHQYDHFYLEIAAPVGDVRPRPWLLYVSATGTFKNKVYTTCY